MQTNELRPDRLRELAVVRPEGARVLSVFLNLDPASFAEPPARASEIRSVVDELRRLSRGESESVEHDAKVAIRADVDRISEFLDDFSPKGAHGLVIYACGPAGLFEVIRLPRPIPSRAARGALFGGSRPPAPVSPAPRARRLPVHRAARRPDRARELVHRAREPPDG